MRLFILSLPAVSLLSACNLVPDRFSNDNPVISPAEEVEAVALDPVEAVPEVMPDAVFSGSATTIAGLGDPTVPGLWMETPLVTTEQMARVRSATGGNVTLTLRPIAGEASAGSRLSIDAMRALGAPLTELVELKVSAAS